VLKSGERERARERTHTTTRTRKHGMRASIYQNGTFCCGNLYESCCFSFPSLPLLGFDSLSCLSLSLSGRARFMEGLYTFRKMRR
jgi:hypothetical protein